MAKTVLSEAMKRSLPVDDESIPPDKRKKDIDLTYSEVQFKFLLRDDDTITEGLEKFVKVATAFSDGVPCKDVVEGFCTSSPDCAELLSLLDVTQKKLKTSQIALVFDCLRHILIRIRSDLEGFSATGEIIVQRILAVHMAQIYNSLRDQNKSNAVKATIQLLIAIVMLNDRSKKAVQSRFNFDHHVFPTLFARRNRKDSEDVRSCLVLLTLAFLLDGDRQVINALVQQKTFIQLTISGLKNDPVEVVVDFIATLLCKVIKGSGISKTLKIKLFSEKVLKQLCDLYIWEGPGGWKKEGGGGGGGRKSEKTENRLLDEEGFKEERETVTTAVHDFLCELCCSQKNGIIFFDKSYGSAKRNQNQILTHLLEFLAGAFDDPLKRDLALNILSSCPDQVEYFLPLLNKHLTPRWSEKWKMYMEFITEVYTRLAKVPPFLMSPAIQVKDVSTIVSMSSAFCLPPSRLKPILAHAIRHKDLRVQRQCLLLVQVMLKKSEAIRRAFLTHKALQAGHLTQTLDAEFTVAVLKALPFSDAVFHCANTVMEAMHSREKDAAVLEDIDFAEHLLTVLQVLNHYLAMLPSLLADQSNYFVNFIDAVGKLQTLRQSSQSEDDGMDVDPEDDPDSKTAQRGDPSTVQISLLKLLANSDTSRMHLGRKGLLEKLLRSAHQNVTVEHQDEMVSLVCKMLTQLDAFATHEDDLQIWISFALRLESSFSSSSSEQKKEKQQKKKTKDLQEARNSADATDVSFSCIGFLSRCLATLINDPVPYMDRITEAVVDSTATLSADQDMESSSAGVNESAIEAILLTDDQELDRALQGPSESRDAPDQSTFTLPDAPISPLSIIALDNLRYSKTDCPSMRRFVSTTLMLTLHCQTNLAVFCTAIKKTDGRLCVGVRDYLEGWATLKKKHVPSFEVFTDEICFPLSLKLLDWMLLSQADLKKAQFIKDLELELTPLHIVEKSAVLDQALFYLSQTASRKGLDAAEKVQRIKLLTDISSIVLSSIIENAKKEDTFPERKSRKDTDGDVSMNQDDEGRQRCNDKNQKHICQAVESILKHPVLWDFFLEDTQTPASKPPKKSRVVLSEIISNFLSLILTKCKMLRLTPLRFSLVEKYMEKSVSCLKERQGIETCMACLEALSVHMDLPVMTRCIMDVLQAPCEVIFVDHSNAGNNSCSLSSAGQIFLQMFKRWLALIQRLSSRSDSFLFPWEYDEKMLEMEATDTVSVHPRTGSSAAHASRSDEEALDSNKQAFADSSSSFSLDLTKMERLFELLHCCNDEALAQDVLFLLTLVPRMSLACPPNVFHTLVDRCLQCSCFKATQNLVKVLLPHATPCYMTHGMRHADKWMGQGHWWFLTACVRNAKLEEVLEEDKQAVHQWVQTHLSTEMTNENEEFWHFLSALASDMAFKNHLHHAVCDFVSENRTSANMHHFSLLNAISSSEGEARDGSAADTSVTNGRSQSDKAADSKKKKRGSRSAELQKNVLDFILEHLLFLLSKKAHRNPDLEENLLALVKDAVSAGKRPTMDFVSASWADFVKKSLKHLFVNPNLLSILSDLAPGVYSQAESGGGGGSVELDAKSMFQLCISHTAFLATLLSDPPTQAKCGLVHLLHALFLVDPHCVEVNIGNVFITAYSASLSETDQRLLHMMQGFLQSAELKEELPVLWGNTALEHRSVSQSLGPSLDTAASVKTFLEQIDSARMSKTILHFPQRRICEDFTAHEASHFMSSSECYDPNYLLRIFIQILSPDKIVPIHSFVAKGCLGFLLVSLTSHHDRNRLMAYRALNEFYSHLDSSKSSEKQELAYILDLLNASRSKDNQRLPFVVALFLSRVVKLMLYPSDHMYLTLLKFLTAKPEMDLSNIPEFYKLFFSAESHFRQERNWILSLLKDGIRDSSDYWLYQKKVVFRIIMAFFNSAMADERSQTLVLEIVANACKQKTTCVDLVKVHCLMSWLATSMTKLNTRPHLVDRLCNLVHTIWFSLSSKVSFEKAVNRSKGVASTKTDDSAMEKEDRKRDHLSELENAEMDHTDETGDSGDGKNKQGKKALVIPKSTIAEMGLVVKSLIWHLNSASSFGVMDLLQVIHSLIKASDIFHHAAQEGDSFSEDVVDSPKPVSPRLFKLSPVETQLLIYFTAKQANATASMTTASNVLRQYNVSMDQLLSATQRAPRAKRGAGETTVPLAGKNAREVIEDGEEEEAEEGVTQGEGGEAEGSLEKEMEDVESNSKTTESGVDLNSLRNALQSVLS